MGLVEKTQEKLAVALDASGAAKERLTGYGKVAQAKAAQLHETMKKLMPQVRYWMKTGKVAANKIINVHIPELYSVVRGKAAKAVGVRTEVGIHPAARRLLAGERLAEIGRT